MKTSTSIALFAGLVSAVPVEKRQFGSGGGFGSTTSNELQSGACRDMIFIFARGSTENGNMGSTVGPPTCSALKSALGSDKVACQGVGGGYSAGVGSNALLKGTDSAGLVEGNKMFALAKSKCPNSQVVAAGYSQGAALIAAVVGGLDATTQAQVKCVVLFGYTKNLQNGGKIPNYPPAQTKVFCNATDGVCRGALAVTLGHLTYTRNVAEAAQFLESKLTTA